MRWGFNELRAQLVSGRLDAECLGLLEKGLRTLDESFPSPDLSHFRWARRFAADARASRNEGFLIDFLSRDTYTTFSEVSLDAIEAWKGGWPEERQILRDLDLDIATSFNPRTRHSLIGVEGTGASFRTLRAQLRLLEVGARYLATAEALDREDPFGGRIRISVEAGTLKAWSAGPDGIDDGGSGKWEHGGKDVVLELKRP